MSLLATYKPLRLPLAVAAALVTVLGYAGSFTAYTFIAPLLTNVTQVSAATIAIFMLIYGVMAAIGNIVGGKLTDHLGADRSSLLVIIAIALVALGMWLFALSPVAMGILVALLGMFTFASVPALQARLIAEAEHHAPQAHGVAAGLNIAGFNLGIALGSMLGSLTLGTAGIIYMGATGALVSALGLGLLVLLITRAKIGK